MKCNKLITPLGCDYTATLTTTDESLARLAPYEGNIMDALRPHPHSAALLRKGFNQLRQAKHGIPTQGVG